MSWNNFSGKGRQREAERALCWLRGWVSPIHVQSELRIICQDVQKPAESKEKIWKSFGKRTFYVPFFLVSIAFCIGAFGGTSTLQTYAVLIFDSLDAPLDKYTAAVFLGLAELVGTLLSVCAIHFTGKRLLTFFSVGGTGMCFCLVAVYGYLTQADMINTENISWIPMTLLIGAAFLSHAGIRLLPWVLAGEVFPVQVGLPPFKRKFQSIMSTIWHKDNPNTTRTKISCMEIGPSFPEHHPNLTWGFLRESMPISLTQTRGK